MTEPTSSPFLAFAPPVVTWDSPSAAVAVVLRLWADGTISDDPRDLLLAFGAWLKINGEAIYGSADFRFTRTGDVLYAIALGWPDPGQWTIHSLTDKAGLLTPDAIKDVRVLGYPDKLEWKQTAAGLTVVAPRQCPCEHAYVFKTTTASLLPSNAERI